MYIQAIYISAFGGLKDYSLRFPEGAALLYGPNERGKSTVLHFLRAMFYGLGDRRGSDNLRERFAPWDGSAMQGHVWFSHEGVSYELVRSFGARKSLDRVSLTNLNENQLVELEDPEQPGRALFGMDEQVFMNSVFVEAGGPGLRKGEESRRALWEQLADFMISPENDVTAAVIMNRLAKAKKSLRSASGRKGEIPVLAAEVVRLDEACRDLQARQEEEAILSAELGRRQEKLAALGAEEEKLAESLELAQYREDLGRLRLAEAPLKEKELLAAEAARADALLDPFGKTQPERREALDRLTESRKALEAEAGRLKIRAEGLAEREAQYRKLIKWGGLAALLPGILLGFLGYLNANPAQRVILFVTGLLFAGGGLLLALWHDRAALWLLGEERAKEAELEEALKAKRAELDEALAKYGFNAKDFPEEEAADRAFINSRLSLWEDRQSLGREIERLEHMAETQEENLGGRTYFAGRLRARREKLEALGLNPEAEAKEQPDAEALAAKLSGLQDEIRLAERGAGETRAKLEALLRDPVTGEAVSPAEALAEHEQLLADAKAAYEAKERRYRALVIAEEHLRDNLVQLRKKILPRLAGRAGVYMKQLSRGRYDSLVADEALELSLKSADGGHYYAPDRFSTGTEDQVYMAFRLALTDHLSAGRNMPLLLDDLLVNFDDRRAAEGLALLAARAEGDGERPGTQVLLFTCHKRLVKLAAEAGWQTKTLPQND